MREETLITKKQTDGEISLYQALPPLLLKWYAGHARPLPWRKDRLPYHVWVSEIMLQQTRAEAVRDHFIRFIAEVPTVRALAELSEERLLKLWEGLGYYSRARNLQKTARIVISEYDGQFPDTYSELLKLPGIGPYTAGAIASICFDRPVPAVDGNVLRILARLLGIAAPMDTPAMKKRIAASLAAVYPAAQSGAFTQSLMELGATVCLPGGMPKCPLCPLSPFCTALRDDAVLQFPVKGEKKSRRVEQVTLLALCCQGSLALRQREEKGLLAGLWELPNVHQELSETQSLELAAQWGAVPLSVTNCRKRRHIFTHIEWEMTCYDITCGARPPSFIWADPTMLSKKYPLPTAFRMFLE